MRIKKLKLEYFLSVRRATLDFDALDAGVFIISGRTGSGKSTIFDGIHYALYGTASNHNRNLRKTLISDFMPENQQMSVVLEFEQSGLVYKIKRTLTPKGSATVQLFLPNGMILDKVAPVTEKIQEVVGLDSSQFDQLAMLEQGNFSKFLLATSTERGELLRDVFNTEIFQKVTDYFVTETNRLGDELNQMNERERMLLGGRTREQLALEVENDKKELAALAEQQSELRESISETQDKLTERLSYEERLQSWKAAQAQLVILERQRPEYEEYVQLRSLYQEMQPVEKLVSEKRRLDSLIFDKESEIQGYDDELNKLPTPALTGYTDILNKYVLERNSWVAAGDSAAEYQRLFDAVQKSEARVKVLEESLEANPFSRLSEELEGIEEQIRIREDYDNRVQEYKEATERIQRNSTMLENLTSELQKAEITAEKTAIDFLLSRAEDRCPICGSPLDSCHTDMSTDVDVDFGVFGRLESEIKHIKEQLEQDRLIEKPASLELPLLSVLRSHYQTAKMKAAEAEQELNTVSAELKYCQANLDALQEDLKKLPVPEHNVDEIREKVQDLDSKIQAVYRQEEERSNLIRQRAAIEDKRLLAADTVESLKNSLTSLLKNELASKFDDYFKNETDLIRYVTNREYYTTLITAFESKYQMYSDVKEPKAPCEEPAVFLRNTVERMQSELYAIHDRQSTLRASQSVLEDSLNKIDAVQEEKVKLLKEFKKYEYLAKQFSGKNDSKISLENFVLHRQLEWILQNSNRFLAELTDGQYQLQLSWESLSGRRQGGLELSVLDTTRGTARASQTFSGGELFMLSLSLSLGLMVSINSVFTAADLDMLYLDEGFGTLDHTTLNRCLNLIQGLKSIKTIGIISHVQDLIEAVPQGFLVEKGIQGSVITPFKR